MENKKPFLLIQAIFSFIILFMSLPTIAEVIGSNTIIKVPTTFSNTTLDMSHGNFIVREGASLTIENCIINGTISAENPNLISVELGKLSLTKNQVSINADSINPTPKSESSFYAIRIGRGSASLVENSFFLSKSFTVGLFTTSSILPATNIQILNNDFHNFHGVLYLLQSHNSVIDGNTFNLNSSGNIVIVGDQSKIMNNSIYFPGLNQLGDGIDIVAAENVTISKNNIFTPTSVGIAITFSRNVLLERNTITGGITYGINILSETALKSPKNFSALQLLKLNKKAIGHLATENITIRNNYLGQNRYGIAATDVMNLTVVNNYFTQRFPDAATRKFWTDNSVLLQNVSGLVWDNNVYKEAFTQINGGDNSMTDFVPFPATGGVIL